MKHPGHRYTVQFTGLSISTQNVQQTLIINGRFLGRPVTGVERFAREIVLALDHQLGQQQNPSARFVLALPPSVHSDLKLQNIEAVNVGKREGHAWEQLDLPKFCQNRFLLNLCNTGPAFKRKQMVIIHDAAVFSVPSAYGFKFRLAYRLLHRTLKSSCHIGTVSEFSKKELCQHLGLRPQQVWVIPESGEHVQRIQEDDAVLDKHGIAKNGYILAVSSNHPAKNFQFVDKALAKFKDNPMTVIVAGGKNNAIFSDAAGTTSSLTRKIGYVSDGELKSLYKNAFCFVYPSIYEGYGLPPVEAMSMGCPVVASQAASIPEVCQDAAIYFDPRDEASFLAALTRITQDTSLRQELHTKAKARSEQLTWAKAAEVLLASLRKIEAMA